MLGTDSTKLEAMRQQPPSEPIGSPGVLVPVKDRGRLYRDGGAMRALGNLMITLGLLLLVTIGGWYGYTQWENQRFKDELVTKFGSMAVEPPVEEFAKPIQAIIALPPAITSPPVPLPALSKVSPDLLSITGKSPVRVDDSPPVRLSIGSVKIDSEVVPIGWTMLPAKGGGQKAEWQVADYAIGHHKGSANPGQPGNVVLSGHVDYKGAVFKNLHKVNKGDEVTLYTERGQYLYVVTDMVLVLEEGASDEQKRRNARYMDPTRDQTLTMITCWPYGIDTHRLIVIAKPYQSPLSAQSEFTIR